MVTACISSGNSGVFQIRMYSPPQAGGYSGVCCTALLPVLEHAEIRKYYYKEKYT